MSAGTITLTNGSAIVGGSGTSFATELAAGDFIVSTVGGVPYTLPVKSVESNAQLTLVSSFTGPTQSDTAWSAVPRVALNMVTAALVAQSAEALRGLNYDKQNWQQVYSAAGNITVKLPDGTTFTGPSWKYLSDNMATKSGGAVPVNQGGTGSTTEPGARKNLGLGSAALKNVGFNPGDIATVHSGRGSSANPVQKIWDGIYEPGVSGALFPESCVIQVLPGPTTSEWGELGIGYGTSNRAFIAKASYSSTLPTGNITVMELWHSHNTTVDANGFLKRASPVVKIFKDGSYETNDESKGVMVTRLDVGQYLIEGCEALNSDAAWGGIDGGFEIPTDRNKQPLIWLDYEVNADGSVLVKTFHRLHPSAPAFARNERAGLADGDPVDIPADQFVCVRVEMPADSLFNQKKKVAEITPD